MALIQSAVFEISRCPLGGNAGRFRRTKSCFEQKQDWRVLADYSRLVYGAAL